MNRYTFYLFLSIFWCGWYSFYSFIENQNDGRYCRLNTFSWYQNLNNECNCFHVNFEYFNHNCICLFLCSDTVLKITLVCGSVWSSDVTHNAPSGDFIQYSSRGFSSRNTASGLERFDMSCMFKKTKQTQNKCGCF